MATKVVGMSVRERRSKEGNEVFRERSPVEYFGSGPLQEAFEFPLRRSFRLAVDPVSSVRSSQCSPRQHQFDGGVMRFEMRKGELCLLAGFEAGAMW